MRAVHLGVHRLARMFATIALAGLAVGASLASAAAQSCGVIESHIADNRWMLAKRLVAEDEQVSCVIGLMSKYVQTGGNEMLHRLLDLVRPHISSAHPDSTDFRFYEVLATPAHSVTEAMWAHLKGRNPKRFATAQDFHKRQCTRMAESFVRAPLGEAWSPDDIECPQCPNHLVGESSRSLWENVDKVCATAERLHSVARMERPSHQDVEDAIEQLGALEKLGAAVPEGFPDLATIDTLIVTHGKLMDTAENGRRPSAQTIDDHLDAIEALGKGMSRDRLASLAAGYSADCEALRVDVQAKLASTESTSVSTLGKLLKALSKLTAWESDGCRPPWSYLPNYYLALDYFEQALVTTVRRSLDGPTDAAVPALNEVLEFEALVTNPYKLKASFQRLLNASYLATTLRDVLSEKPKLGAASNRLDELKSCDPLPDSDLLEAVQCVDQLLQKWEREQLIATIREAIETAIARIREDALSEAVSRLDGVPEQMEEEQASPELRVFLSTASAIRDVVDHLLAIAKGEADAPATPEDLESMLDTILGDANEILDDDQRGAFRATLERLSYRSAVRQLLTNAKEELDKGVDIALIVQGLQTPSPFAAAAREVEFKSDSPHAKTRDALNAARDALRELLRRDQSWSTEGPTSRDSKIDAYLDEFESSLAAVDAVLANRETGQDSNFRQVVKVYLTSRYGSRSPVVGSTWLDLPPGCPGEAGLDTLLSVRDVTGAENEFRDLVETCRSEAKVLSDPETQGKAYRTCTYVLDSMMDGPTEDGPPTKLPQVAELVVGRYALARARDTLVEKLDLDRAATHTDEALSFIEYAASLPRGTSGATPACTTKLLERLKIMIRGAEKEIDDWPDALPPIRDGTNLDVVTVVRKLAQDYGSKKESDDFVHSPSDDDALAFALSVLAYKEELVHRLPQVTETSADCDALRDLFDFKPVYAQHPAERARQEYIYALQKPPRELMNKYDDLECVPP